MAFGRNSHQTLNKFGAIKTQVDGITFASRREANRYLELRMLERAGQITGLELQPEFVLLGTFKHAGQTVRGIKYIADFRYFLDGKEIIEDSKGHRTKDYLIKKKLFLFKFPDKTHLET